MQGIFCLLLQIYPTPLLPVLCLKRLTCFDHNSRWSWPTGSTSKWSEAKRKWSKIKVFPWTPLFGVTAGWLCPLAKVQSSCQVVSAQTFSTCSNNYTLRLTFSPMCGDGSSLMQTVMQTDVLWFPYTLSILLQIVPLLKSQIIQFDHVICFLLRSWLVHLILCFTKGKEVTPLHIPSHHSKCLHILQTFETSALCFWDCQGMWNKSVPLCLFIRMGIMMLFLHILPGML